jgi:hypothetical protein
METNTIPKDLRFWHESLCDDQETYFNAPVAEVRKLIERVAVLEGELSRERRTMKFWEESYLAEHGHLRQCKWKPRALALEVALRKIADHRTQLPWRACADIAREALNGE